VFEQLFANSWLVENREDMTIVDINIDVLGGNFIEFFSL
jgi:hypothetical protein